MNLEIPGSAVDARITAMAMFDAAGGVDLARECEANPARRVEAAELLSRFGIDDLDPRDGVESAMVAASLCRAAGSCVFPYPVVGRIMGDDQRMLGVATPGALRINHGDIGSWEIAGLKGGSVAVVAGEPIRQPLAPFVADVVPVGEITDRPEADVALWLALDAWVILGAMERALSLTVEYLPSRKQFERPLASFQALRFRVADLSVSLRGIEELAKFTVWRHFDAHGEALTDALALRVAAVEASREIFRNSHLLHGAIGFCDEHDLSFLNRHVQPHIRLPWDYHASSQLLLDQVEKHGLATLYGDFGGSAKSRIDGRMK
jgi:hypothetical protein